MIEAIGLAILPARLIQEIADLKAYYFNQTPLPKASEIHKTWFDQFSSRQSLTQNNFDSIIEFEIGQVFEQVLIDCGVFKTHNQNDFINFIKEHIYERLIK